MYNDIIKEAERAIMDGFMIEATQMPISDNAKNMIKELNELPKANHIDYDFLALKRNLTKTAK